MTLLSKTFDTILPKVKEQPGHNDDPRSQLRAFFRKAAGLTHKDFFLNPDAPVAGEALQSIASMVERANAGEPTQYITGEQWFWKGAFQVGPGVLIPRPETELLVEKILEKCPRGHRRFAELGAGSGNIGVSCLSERADWEWYAWELSPIAASYAELNARSILGNSTTYQIRKGNFLTAVLNDWEWDAVVSNPPYVASELIPSLSPQVQKEPVLALDGGPDGLKVIEQFVERASRLLKPQGLIAFEIGEEQRWAVQNLLERTRFTQIEFFQDLSGIDRVVTAVRG
ncbi:MAG: peptide chain release factor N(5)-glutamine methyltransferase [Deltaproteobacteria bacterium]|nr:peptide chain release factor N(5)-glutamine methyltransferase [Deltaproteobacteria bacterium]MBI3295534.1 peptide chain release factor N(5)-glutamine methyltransferase [Deltaproteobacteria bacterium]